MQAKMMQLLNVALAAQYSVPSHNFGVSLSDMYGAMVVL